MAVKSSNRRIAPPAEMREIVPVIEGERLLRNLTELRRFGACGKGVVRRCLTPSTWSRIIST